MVISACARIALCSSQYTEAQLWKLGRVPWFRQILVNQLNGHCNIEVGTIRRAQASLAHRAVRAAAAAACCWAHKKPFSFRVQLLRRKSQLLLPNSEKTNLVKYKIYLLVQPKLKWDHAASSIIADHWDFERVTRSMESLDWDPTMLSFWLAKGY